MRARVTQRACRNTHPALTNSILLCCGIYCIIKYFILKPTKNTLELMPKFFPVFCRIFSQIGRETGNSATPPPSTYLTLSLPWCTLCTLARRQQIEGKMADHCVNNKSMDKTRKSSDPTAKMQGNRVSYSVNLFVPK